MSSQSHVPVQSTKHFSEKDLETIKRSENEQNQFKKLVATSKDFSEAEKAVINFETVAEFDIFWQQANSAKETFDQSHEKGCGLWSKSYQSSAVVVQSFMKDFSPIIEIVKDFAAPYGGMAVGTISILFAVAGNKDEMEERLASTISAIKDRLPGLKLYQHIYNDDHELDMRLQDRIVSAYQGFIEFCIAATKYYKSGGRRRWLRAFVRPNIVFDKADQVQAVIVDIRQLCEELLDKNVHSIKQLAHDQKLTIKELEAKVTELLEARNNSNLNEIRRLLNLSAFSEGTQRKELDKYRHALESDDHLNAAYFQQMRGSRLDSFKSCKDYQSWITSEKSCLLILSGYNNESIAYLDQCWLSPVAMAMITDLSQNFSGPIYAYYIFPQQGELLYHALSVILLQLLRQKSQALANETQGGELRTELCELQKYEQAGKNPTETEGKRLSAFDKVILRVISFFDESETVHIILDRADRCCDLKREIDHRKALLQALVKMVEAARFKLKVLVVINAIQWRVETRQDELEVKMKERVIIHTREQGNSA